MPLERGPRNRPPSSTWHQKMVLKLDPFFGCLVAPILTLFGAKMGLPNWSKTLLKSIFRVLNTRSCQIQIFVTPPYQKPYFWRSWVFRKSQKFHLEELFHVFKNIITNLNGSRLQFSANLAPKKVPKKSATCLSIHIWHQSVPQRRKIAAFGPSRGPELLFWHPKFLPKIKK